MKHTEILFFGIMMSACTGGIGGNPPANETLDGENSGADLGASPQADSDAQEPNNSDDTTSPTDDSTSNTFESDVSMCESTVFPSAPDDSTCDTDNINSFITVYSQGGCIREDYQCTWSMTWEKVSAFRAPQGSSCDLDTQDTSQGNGQDGPTVTLQGMCSADCSCQ